MRCVVLCCVGVCFATLAPAPVAAVAVVVAVWC